MDEYTHHVNRGQVDRWRDTMLQSLNACEDNMQPEDFLVVLAEVASYGTVYLTTTGWASKETLFPWLCEMIGALLGIEGFQSGNVSVGITMNSPILDAFEEVAKRSWDANEGS